MGLRNISTQESWPCQEVFPPVSRVKADSGIFTKEADQSS